jgi:uncharacterized protein (DUF2237 family)
MAKKRKAKKTQRKRTAKRRKRTRILGVSYGAGALCFPGLKPGDRWCLCAPRSQEAFEENRAPRVVLRATHEATLSYCSLADLKHLAVDLA